MHTTYTTVVNTIFFVVYVLKKTPPLPEQLILNEMYSYTKEIEYIVSGIYDVYVAPIPTELYLYLYIVSQSHQRLEVENMHV